MGKLKVRFDTPQNGWIKIQTCDDDSELALDISYTPFHLIKELIEAIIRILDKESAIANGSFNPERYEFEFRNENDVVDLHIKRFPDHRHIKGLSEIMFKHSGDKLEICKAFWRGFKNLEGKCLNKTFENSYHRRFPVKDLEYLSEKLLAGEIS